MTKEPPAEPRADDKTADNVVPFPQKPGVEIDEDKYRILSVLLANEFANFKGRPLL